MKLRIFTIAIVFLCFFAMPFLVVYAGAVPVHTHICHDEQHDVDCIGTKECCRICQGTYRVKSQFSNCIASNKVFSTPAYAWFVLGMDFECTHITYIDLVSLKVRLNN